MSQQINLLNRDLLGPARPPLSALTMAQIIGVVAVVAVGLYGYFWYETGRLRESAAAGEKRLAGERKRLAELSAQLGIERKSQLLENEIKSAETRLRQYREAVSVLKSGDFGNTEGYSEFLRALARQSVGGLWLTGFAIEGKGSAVALAGCATRAELVPVYLQRLNAEPAMNGVRFSGLEISQPKGTDPGKDAVPFLEFSLRSAGGEASR
ncbi:MAG: PilN domain-containing protein [Pseudomonadota bacterium]